MRERPILFNAEMVNAILSGRKTQTRRIIKLDHERGMVNPVVRGRNGEISSITCRLAPMLCPLGKPGDQLWGREAYRMARSLDTHSPSKVAELSLNAGYKNPWAPIQLEADGTRIGKWTGFDTPPVITEAGKLRPSLHMPRWASRINLLITGVRVEQLQDISEQDAMAEGITAKDVIIETRYEGGGHVEITAERFFFVGGDDEGYESAEEAFAELWDSIYGQKEGENWQANPWVWVIEFELIKGSKS